MPSDANVTDAPEPTSMSRSSPSTARVSAPLPSVKPVVSNCPEPLFSFISTVPPAYIDLPPPFSAVTTEAAVGLRSIPLSASVKRPNPYLPLGCSSTVAMLKSRISVVVFAASSFLPTASALATTEQSFSFAVVASAVLLITRRSPLPIIFLYSSTPLVPFSSATRDCIYMRAR